MIMIKYLFMSTKVELNSKADNAMAQTQIIYFLSVVHASIVRDLELDFFNSFVLEQCQQDA